MMKRLILLLLTGLRVSAAEPEYPVASIPAALLKNANAVVRVQEQHIKMNSLKDVRVLTRYVVTVLNEAGSKHAAFYDYYSQLREIKSIKGVLYDASGKQIRKLKQNEIKDESFVSDFSLMEDDRLKSHHFYHRVYPYTVEYEEEARISQTFFIPRWAPQDDEFLSVQESRLSFTVPADYQLRYKQFNYKGEPVQTPGKGEKTYSWEVKDLPALENEPMEAALHYRTTVVYLAPSDFSYGAYTGKMNSWDDFGKFIAQLNAGRDVLPEKTKSEVHALVDKVKDEREKIRLLYKYMQEHTRYISIQMGIGGYQPFDASYVSTKGYGDCKALSNYMYALLKEAGIRSHYVLVKAGIGNTDLVEDFAVNQFDHAILCVPSAKDTIWLECTSQISPFAYLGSFTNNRPVLLITGNGGKLVRTPDYRPELNQQNRLIKAVIDEQGGLKGSTRTHLTGLQQDWHYQFVHTVSPEKQLESLKERLNLPRYDINKFHYAEFPDASPVPSMDETLDITAPNYASISGKRLFIIPNVLNRSGIKLDEESVRTGPIRLSNPYRDVDTVSITIPEGYTPESVFKDLSLESPFGKYSASAKVEGNRITYIRVMEMKDGMFPAKDYAALESFFNTIYKADRSRIIFVKATSP